MLVLSAPPFRVRPGLLRGCLVCLLLFGVRPVLGKGASRAGSRFFVSMFPCFYVSLDVCVSCSPTWFASRSQTNTNTKTNKNKNTGTSPLGTSQ